MFEGIRERVDRQGQEIKSVSLVFEQNGSEVTSIQSAIGSLLSLKQKTAMRHSNAGTSLIEESCRRVILPKIKLSLAIFYVFRPCRPTA